MFGKQCLNRRVACMMFGTGHKGRCELRTQRREGGTVWNGVDWTAGGLLLSGKEKRERKENKYF